MRTKIYYVNSLINQSISFYFWIASKFSLLLAYVLSLSDLLFELTLHSGLLTIGSAVATGTDDVDRLQVVFLSGSAAQILSCSTDLEASVALYHKPWKSNEDADEIYDRYAMLNGYSSKYEVSRSSPRNYTLGTQDVQGQHAGEYSCYDNDGIGRHLSTADLTVIGEYIFVGFKIHWTIPIFVICK